MASDLRDLLRADRLFFPAAALHAALIVALRAAEASGHSVLASLPPYWHGHEMLFGFAPALMAGYLLNGLGPDRIVLLFCAWLLARAGFFAQPERIEIAAPLLLLYPLGLALLAGGRLSGAAKSLRNALFPAILAAPPLAEGLYLLDWPSQSGMAAHAGLALMSGLVTLMLFAMGGRIIAAATSGAHRSLGRTLPYTAQIDLEMAGVALLLPALLLDSLGRFPPIAGAASLAAGGIVALRLVRWQVLRLGRKSGLMPLHIAYGLLGCGLVFKGAAQILDLAPLFGASHLVYVGALGLLAALMTLRASRQRDRLSDMAHRRAEHAVMVLIGLSLPFRLAALFVPDEAPILIVIAAAFWSAGFLSLAALLVHHGLRARKSGRKPSAKRR
ncbi:MAG: NnrS family protein [Rhodothalassiaceae bacterium]